MIKIDISSDPKYSVNGPNNVYFFSFNIAMASCLLNVFYNINATVNFDTFELVIEFVMVSKDVIIM